MSLWTLSGRMIFPLAYGEYQGQRFDRIKGQVDLVYRDGRFDLFAAMDLPDEAAIEVKEFIGVDLGIVNLATDSDGTRHTGDTIEKVRRRRHESRRSYQKTGTQSAKRRLKRMARREANFRRNENHRIANELVKLAKDTDRGIGLEDLTHIRERTTVRAKDRAKHSGWAFAQLQGFVCYKAKLAGIPVVFVDARDTSRTCSACGHCEKANRKNRSDFACRHCGFSEDADLNAARNVRDRANVKWLDLAGNDDPGLESRAS